MNIELTMFHTVAIAVLALLLGEWIKSKIYFLEKFCIPSPVVGGLVVTVITLIGHLTNSFTINFDFGLSDFFMLAFYTSIGFTASISLLKRGGVKTIKLLILASILVVFQNGIGVIISKAIGVNPLVGIATGSIPMTGGHGTSAVFAGDLEKLGLSASATITLASATFGLVAGALTGGPLGRYLVEKSKKNKKAKSNESINFDFSKEFENPISPKGFEQGIFLLLLAMALGTVISSLLEKTGLTFPSSVGGMLASALIVNIKNFEKVYPIRHSEIQIFGTTSLAVFLALSMIKLKLWEIADLAGPMLLLLFCQVALVVVFMVFIAYPIMGKDYEAAVTCSGFCGFALGAVPTGVANMRALVEKYEPAPESFFIVPLVGSLFINIVNSVVVTLFMNMV
ncbi:MAG: sodium/glutamate symporter [Tissierellia bacterium]|nr:sodium/glutamate symporter [Tissierellia bacterium]